MVKFLMNKPKDHFDDGEDDWLGIVLVSLLFSGACKACPIRSSKGNTISVSQLIYNLFTNALKFTKPGIPPNISIRSETGKGSELGNANLSPSTRIVIFPFPLMASVLNLNSVKKYLRYFNGFHGRANMQARGLDWL